MVMLILVFRVISVRAIHLSKHLNTISRPKGLDNWGCNVFMFQSGTVVYSILLVIFTVLGLRLHSCYCCVKLGNQCGKTNVRSIVDGLSAFLVLCYFPCTKITLRILNSATIRGKNEKLMRSVPWFLSDTKYFDNNHLPYAIPAIFCLIVVIIPPPCILVLEFMFTKLFNLPIWGGAQTLQISTLKLEWSLCHFWIPFKVALKSNVDSLPGYTLCIE